MGVYTDGVVPWNNLDDNTRLPQASELENGYPCGEADQALFNWTAGWPIGNIWNMILQSGITPARDKLLDLARAVQAGKVNYVTAGGTATALTAMLSPAPQALIEGMIIKVKIATSNSGPATLNVNSLGAIPIQTHTGAALKSGDLPAGAIIPLVYNAGTWRLQSFAYSEIPVVATADVTLYVRTDGDDGNNGSANNAANAFATISAAINYGLSRFAFAGFNLIIQLGNSGTYAPIGNIPPIAGSLIIRGSIASQGNFIIAGNPVAGSQAYVCATGGFVSLQGVTINNSSTTIPSALATRGGALEVSNVTFASTVSIFAHMVGSSGSITIGSGCIVAGNAAQCLLGQASGSVTVSANIAVPNSLNMSAAWAVTSTNGNIIWSQAGITFTGSGGSGGTSTGQRYNASLNGVINTSGGGSLAFPGNVAGTTSSGGQYA